jgi:hypothetical protein
MKPKCLLSFLACLPVVAILVEATPLIAEDSSSEGAYPSPFNRPTRILYDGASNTEPYSWGNFLGDVYFQGNPWVSVRALRPWGGKPLSAGLGSLSAYLISNNLTGTGTNGIFVVFLGDNDPGAYLAHGCTNVDQIIAGISADYLKCAELCHSNGWQFGVFTINGNNGRYATPLYQTVRYAVNDFIRTNTFWDYLCDVDKLLPEQSTPYLRDGIVHYNRSFQRIIAAMVYDTLRQPPHRGVWNPSPDLNGRDVRPSCIGVYMYPGTTNVMADTHGVYGPDGAKLSMTSRIAFQPSNLTYAVTNERVAVPTAMALRDLSPGVWKLEASLAFDASADEASGAVAGFMVSAAVDYSGRVMYGTADAQPRWWQGWPTTTPTTDLHRAGIRKVPAPSFFFEYMVTVYTNTTIIATVGQVVGHTRDPNTHTTTLRQGSWISAVKMQ